MLSAEMEMENVVYGTGRQRGWFPSGKLTMGVVYLFYGTLMRLVKLLLLDGMD
jgi:hypothetical protein